MTYNEYCTLVNAAKRHNYLYFVEGRPEISDSEFDGIISNIEAYEKAHPYSVLPDSPTQSVGSDLNGNGRRLIAHRTPMLSQQKAYTSEDLYKWLLSTSSSLFCVEWKYDGVSCSLVYIDGSLCSAATRGNGNSGQDITSHVMQMPSVPKTISEQGRVEVRGEVVCPKGIHSSLGYNDERTAAASILNASYSANAGSLVFLPWEVIADGFNSFSNTGTLAQWGFLQTESRLAHDHNDIAGIISEATSRREDFAFPVDGLVIKVDSFDDFRNLGKNATYPKGSIAFKFEAESVCTKVVRIEKKVSKSGRKTPVAHVVPVVLRGKTITKINLFSEKTMNNLGVTEGCTVKVVMQGDVIAKISEVVNSATSTPTPASPAPRAVQKKKVVNYYPKEVVLPAITTGIHKPKKNHVSKPETTPDIEVYTEEDDIEIYAEEEAQPKKMNPFLVGLLTVGVIALFFAGLGVGVFLLPAICGVFKH